MSRPEFGTPGFKRDRDVVTLIPPDRQPPYAPEAEVSVLGGMLIDANAVAKAIEVVDDTMFYRESNRRVFRAMARLFQKGGVIDPVTIREELQKT
ncbi:MAG: DnaB-like helicase N-terminal domain-containing protein, partial [Longimicrobiales bacterium]